LKRILVNATNLTGWGSAAIGLSLLPALAGAMPEDDFILLAPDEGAFRRLEYPANVRAGFFKRASGLRNDIARLGELLAGLPEIARRERADVCLTLGDLSPLRLPCPQVLFVQQPLLAYSRREIGASAGWNPAKRLFMTAYFRRSARGVSEMVVQTPVMAARLAERFGVDPRRIGVVPQPVPKHVEQGTGSRGLLPAIAACEKPLKLLFLAGGYPHKNHAILPPLARELRSRGLAGDVQIFSTLDRERPGCRGLLERLRPHADVVTNLGRIPGPDVVPALRASSALFLPTLAESYGLIYLEALACERPVLTSDRDFARWMCRDLARYFDPRSPGSIAGAIAAFRTSPGDPARLARMARARLDDLPRNWQDVALAFRTILTRALDMTVT